MSEVTFTIKAKSVAGMKSITLTENEAKDIARIMTNVMHGRLTIAAMTEEQLNKLILFLEYPGV